MVAHDAVAAIAATAMAVVRVRAMVRIGDGLRMSVVRPGPAWRARDEGGFL
ncbi:hypothetical protein Ais01nite_13340 [Asanoa ishikariensis]|nr:hypothetical protein Ais01nite_13340 [Asanoa ishikariensis]